MIETIRYGVAALTIIHGGQSKDIIPANSCFVPQPAPSPVDDQMLNRYSQLVDKRYPSISQKADTEKEIDPLPDLSPALKLVLIGGLLMWGASGWSGLSEFSEHASPGQKRWRAAAFILQLGISLAAIADTFR